LVILKRRRLIAIEIDQHYGEYPRSRRIFVCHSAAAEAYVKAWQKQLENALVDFTRASELAGHPVFREDLQVELLTAPHRPPSALPAGKIAVFCFWANGSWLKIGAVKAGSAASYTFREYNVSTDCSTLASLLEMDEQMQSVDGLGGAAVGEWIRQCCCRANILFPVAHGDAKLEFLRAFLNLRLLPRYS
jgi:hypothetical protein